MKQNVTIHSRDQKTQYTTLQYTTIHYVTIHSLLVLNSKPKVGKNGYWLSLGDVHDEHWKLKQAKSYKVVSYD